MQRYQMWVQYDGTDYCGFQRQPQDPTIQGALESVLSQLAAGPVGVVGAGRTDSGVHARQQCVHFDADLSVPLKRLPLAVNGLLPPDIRVMAAEYAREGFHARYDALEKTYCYQIWQGPYADVFWRRYSLWQKDPLDWAAVEEAAAVLRGTRSFASFAAAGGSAKTTVRTLRRLEIAQRGPLACLYFTADGFLYNMVRNMVGTLLEVARGKQPAQWVDNVLAAEDRSAAGPTAPGHGLVLEEVKYP